MPKKMKTAVVFVHGLAKKPSPEKLEEIWLWALGRNGPHPEVFGPGNPGIDLNDQGVTFSFTYWADVFYGSDFETDVSDQYEKVNDIELMATNIDAIAGELKLPKHVTTREIRFLAEFERKLSEANSPSATLTSSVLAPQGAPKATVPGQFEIASWLPGPLKQAIIRKAAMEAYYYLFNKEYERSDGTRFRVQDELRKRLIKDLQAANESAEKVVIVSHSMGTMIAYDVLRNMEACPAVSTLFTLGSPLGITEVQDELREERETVDFPASKLQHWINVYDPLDPICGLDPRFANDFAPVDGKRIVDIEESNWGNWRHTITHYLAGVKFRTSLANALGINRS